MEGHAATTPAGPDEVALLRRLRARDEAALADLVERYHGALTRLALTFVPSRAVAEEVVQETWLGVIRGIDRFEGRSSLRTWVFRILVNRARTRGVQEARSIPFSCVADPAGEDEPGVDPDRFLGPDHRWAGHWAVAPQSWAALPEDRLLSRETLAVVDATVAALPPAQREVITLRDIEGWEAAEVCALLGVSDGNQRVLLHRARSRVRAALEAHFDDAALAAAPPEAPEGLLV
ncbi:MAG TPA: sigma-70 family RNA polymerase sigma factor [Miltoncostaeaceae bacterium]|nr:sigma-70 family RNA polymerase sigma factor [Miltoncostaeaceae bacterium]